LLWTIIILVLSFIKLPEATGPELIPYADKLVHFFLYFVLAFLLVREGAGKLVTVIILILLGGGVEILQGILTTYRSADFFDFLSDLAGGLLGLYHKNIIQLFK